MTHVCGLLFPANTIEEYYEQIQWFAEDVIPHVSQ